MKISVDAVRKLEHALKAAADEAMAKGQHELEADAIRPACAEFEAAIEAAHREQEEKA